MMSEQFDFLSRVHAYCAAALTIDEMAGREEMTPSEFTVRLRELGADLLPRRGFSLLWHGGDFEGALAVGSLMREGE